MSLQATNCALIALRAVGEHVSDHIARGSELGFCREGRRVCRDRSEDLWGNLRGKGMIIPLRRSIRVRLGR